ncbi:transposase [bacterium]|nr:transposase [bacterium]
MARLEHFDDIGTARFVTMCCHQRLKLLQKPKIARLFLDELFKWKQKYEVKVLAYVIMPDHVHMVLCPTKPMKIGRAIGELKSLSAKRMLPLLPEDVTTQMLWVNRNGESRRVFWMRRCHDHNCRTPEVVLEKIKYCHKNPVQRGLAKNQGDWLWSSYRWYEGETDGPVEIDSIELQ